MKATSAVCGPYDAGGRPAGRREMGDRIHRAALT